MKRAIIASTVCLCMSAFEAEALDWSLDASLTETLELNSNQFLRSMLAGGTLGSYTTVAANAVARTPTSRLYLDADGTYQKYWGPGTAGIPSTEFTNYGFHGRYETFGKNPANREYVDASWRSTSTALAVLADLGVQTQATGNINTATLRGGIERDLTARDSATLSARSSLSYYDPSSGGTQFLDTAALATWRHRVSGIATLKASSEVEWLNYDNASNTSILVLRNQAGFDLAFSPLLNFQGSIGAAYVKASRGSPGSQTVAPPLLTGALTSGSGSAVSLIGDMAIIYRILKSTTLSLTANRSVGPTVIGSLQETTSIGAQLAYSINQLSTLSFSANVSRLSGLAQSTDFFSATVAYNRALTREWRTNLSYRYLHRTGSSEGLANFDPITGLSLASGSGPASSHAIILVVSRNITVIPSGN